MIQFPRRIFVFWLISFYATWLFLINSGPGLAIYFDNWMYAVMMMFGATVAGATPMGGGAVAFPVLSLYFDIDPLVAKNFSLMIQSIGMTSASIIVLSRRSRTAIWYKNLIFYIACSYLGFLLGTAALGSWTLPWVKMIYVSLALAFIMNFWITRKFGTNDKCQHSNSKDKSLIVGGCFLGGVASAFFGNGADMFIYIMLSLFFHMKEKEAVDISIVVMAAISILGVAANLFIFQNIQYESYVIWLVAAPVVAVFAPLGNLILHVIPVSAMLAAVLMLCAVNYAYYIFVNPNDLVTTLACLLMFSLIFFLIDRTQKVKDYDPART